MGIPRVLHGLGILRRASQKRLAIAARRAVAESLEERRLFTALNLQTTVNQSGTIEGSSDVIMNARGERTFVWSLAASPNPMVMARRYNSIGEPLENEHQIGSGGRVAIAGNKSGQYAFAALRDSGSQLEVQCFNAAGAVLWVKSIPVNSNATPAIAMNNQGDVVFAYYSSYSGAGSTASSVATAGLNGLNVYLYNSTGTFISSNTYTDGARGFDPGLAIALNDSRTAYILQPVAGWYISQISGTFTRSGAIYLRTIRPSGTSFSQANYVGVTTGTPTVGQSRKWTYMGAELDLNSDGSLAARVGETRQTSDININFTNAFELWRHTLQISSSGAITSDSNTFMKDPGRYSSGHYPSAPIQEVLYLNDASNSLQGTAASGSSDWIYEAYPGRSTIGSTSEYAMVANRNSALYAWMWQGNREVWIEPVDASGNVLANNSTVLEGNFARFRIGRTGMNDAVLRVRYQVTGTSDVSDHEAGANGFVDIAAGQTYSNVISIRIRNEDGPEENNMDVDTLPDGQVNVGLESLTLSLDLNGSVAGIPNPTGAAGSEEPGFSVDSSRVDATYWIMDANAKYAGIKRTDGFGIERTAGGDRDRMEFQLLRTGDLSLPQQVTVDLSGTADWDTGTGVVTASTPPVDGDYRVEVNAGSPTPVRSGNRITFTIPAGQGQQLFRLEPLNDNKVEGIEWVVAAVVDPNDVNQYRLSATPDRRQTRGSLIDDEIATVMLNQLDGSMAEAGGGSDYGELEITRQQLGRNEAALPVTLALGGSATAVSDYQIVNQTAGWSIPVGGTIPVLNGGFSVTIPAGVDAVRVRLLPADDALPENDERISVSLAENAGYFNHPTLATAELKIIDNDRPQVSIQAIDAAAQEPLNKATFRLTRSNTSLSQPLSIQLMVDPASTAAWGADYILPAGLAVTIPAGLTSCDFDLTPLADKRSEPTPETVTLKLLPMNGYDLNAPLVPDTATITIADYVAGTTLASFDWSMRQRYGIDRDLSGQKGFGLTDLPNSWEYAQGYDWNSGTQSWDTSSGTGFWVDLDASTSAGSGGIASYDWSVQGPQGSPIIAHGIKPSVKLQDDTTYNVSLTITDSNGAATSQSQLVHVNDIVVLSLGDSFASGEGVPEVPSATLLNGWGTAFGLPGVTLPTATWADGMSDAMDVENQMAHRSTLAGSSLAAMDLERSDPHSSVTFVFLAESGAEVMDGVLTPKSEGYDHSGSFQKSQLDEAKDILGSRTIDSLHISIGGNDVGFSDIIKSYVFRFKYVKWWINHEESKSLDSIKQAVDEGLRDLPARYAYLNESLKNKFGSQLPPASSTYVTGYPDPSGGNDGQPADMLSDLTDNFIGDAGTFLAHYSLPILTLGAFRITDLPLRIDAEEAGHARQYAVIPINNAVRRAAQSYGWNYIAPSSTFATHGYAATNHWFRRANEALLMQGGKPYEGVGAVHPNDQGHRVIGDTIEASSLLGKPAPVITLPDTVDVVEGSLSSLTASANTSGLSLQWDTNFNGSSFVPTANLSASTIALDASTSRYPQSRRVAVKATDALGRVGFGYTTLVFTNGTSGRVPSEVASVNAGEPFRLALQRQRVDDPVNHWRIDWGDSSSEIVPGDWSSRTKIYSLGSGETSHTFAYKVWLTDRGGEIPVQGGSVTVVKDDPFPRVSVQAITATTSEQGGAPGQFKFTRSGQLNLPLSISIGLSSGAGRATNGVDYVGPGNAPLPLSVFFAAGQSTVTIDITAIADADKTEGTEAVDVTINPSSLYSITGNPTATVSITDGPSTALGAIAGKAFDDVNGNGAQDAGESSLSNWQVVLDLNKNGVQDSGEPVAVTDSSGNYIHPQQPSASYQLLLVPQLNWVATTPTVVSEIVVAGSATTGGVDFAVSRPVTMSGVVFDDSNLDGTFNTASETPQPGVIVFADLDNDGSWDTNEPKSTTDTSGAYTLANVPAGTRYVTVVPLGGYTSTNSTADGGALKVSASGGQSLSNISLGQRRIGPANTGTSVSSSTLSTGGTLTATALGVEPAAALVRFYLETNGVAGLQTDGAMPDAFLGTDAKGPDPFAVDFRVAYPSGTYRIYSQAEDAVGRSGSVTSSTFAVTGTPTSPSVSITANGPFAREGTGSGDFVLRRSGNNLNALTVDLAFLSGANLATRGDDYADSGNTVVIPAGQDLVHFYIAPQADTAIEADEAATVQVAAGSGYGVGASSTASITIIDSSVASIRTTTPLFDRLARSHTISMYFSDDVSATLSVDDFVVTNLTTGLPVSSTATTLLYDHASNRATLQFDGVVNGSLSGLFADGRYTVSLLSGGVSDLQGHQPAANISSQFAFLQADATLDDKVNTLDFNVLAGKFGITSQLFTDGDFNYDGTVDSVDFAILVAQYGKSLPSDAALQPATSMFGDSSFSDGRTEESLDVIS